MNIDCDIFCIQYFNGHMTWKYPTTGMMRGLYKTAYLKKNYTVKLKLIE